MFQDLGKRVRQLRQKRGIGLNAFAEMLEVSPGYLSNLETGKTDTIQLSLLSKLQQELSIIPLQSNKDDHDIEKRLHELLPPLIELSKHNPLEAKYLLDSLERGVDVFYRNLK